MLNLFFTLTITLFFIATYFLSLTTFLLSGRTSINWIRFGVKPIPTVALSNNPLLDLISTY